MTALEHFDTGPALAEELTARHNLPTYPMTAFTGGGGKTSLMFSLARALARRGRVVVTTTTKIFPPKENEADQTFVCSSEEAIQNIAASPKRSVVAAGGAIVGGKLAGYTPQEADGLLKSGVADWVLVEADGARRKPLKAYAEWEPPVPPLATLHFVVAGADAFTSPLSEETVCRFEAFETHTGLRSGDFLNAEKAAALFSDEREYLKHSPPDAVRMFFLNKAELLDGETREALVSELAAKLKGYDRLIAASIRDSRIYADIALKRS